jgi:Na+-transporting NADH:ubiquinone oxidoreductase subunit A
MAHTIKIRKGRDIRLKGAAEKNLDTSVRGSVYAIKPTDFHSLVPKLAVKEGDRVKAGDTLFYDKVNELIKFNAPVSGTVKAIVRGEKRRILAVEIAADASTDYRDFGTVNPAQTNREALLKHMLESGFWPSIVQRPFSIVARPENKPKAVFISGFESAPLAGDPDFTMEGQMDDFQTGVDALKVLSGGKPVHLSHRGGSKVYANVKGVTLHEVNGPHPAGNVGVQIHHIDPINKGETVWTVHPQDVANIGRFLKTGKFNPQRVVALVGSKVNSPRYFRVTAGISLGAMINGNVDTTNCRIISGDVLNGDALSAENYLGFYHTQVTVIPEGHEAKFFLTDGWLSPGFSKLSFSKAYPAWLLGKNKAYDVDTNNNGEHRAFVVTGQYEQVFPFDIYPVHLVKAIMVNDIDLMEKLGIYEVAPEDFALCEFACTSKIDVQDVVRSGIDVVMAEFS